MKSKKDSTYIESAIISKPYITIQAAIPHSLFLRIKRINKTLEKSGKKFNYQKSMLKGLQSGMNSAMKSFSVEDFQNFSEKDTSVSSGQLEDTVLETSMHSEDVSALTNSSL